MPKTYKAERGSTRNLGPRFVRRRKDGASGINFAVFSTQDQVFLEIFRNVTDREPRWLFEMERTRDPTDSGWIYHLFLPKAGNRTLYNFRVGDKRILDPYAQALVGKPGWNAHGATVPRCVAYKSRFDWQGDKHPNTPLADSVIYEVLVHGFTGHWTSRCDGESGTFAGMIRKIPYLKELGITAVELMPIFEFDPRDCPFKCPITGTPLHNVWGYNTVGFFAPDANFSYYGKMGEQMDGLKELVRELHNAGIEVILDIVINHTREGNHEGPALSFKALANNVYYMMQPDGFYNDWTGCGNTLNTNHPVVQRMIIDCLRWWVQEYHVDGFRFDLAAVFAVDVDQQEKWQATPIIAAIENDPVLAGRKLIAEPWGPRQYLLRNGPFNRERWANQSDTARDTYRRAAKGDMGVARLLQQAIEETAGEIVFTTCHDGFTVKDCVSYNEKHNHLGGQGNRDGHPENHSWNCGHEGRTLKDCTLPEPERREIWRRRRQLMKNLLALPLLSRGTPMLLYGDEIGRSQDGNNNTVFLERPTLLNWSLRDKYADMLQFVKGMIALRRRHTIQARPIIWHGVEPNAPDFDDYSRMLAWEYEPIGPIQGNIYVASNAYWEGQTFTLPAPTQGRVWHRLVDTSLAPMDAIVPEEAGVSVRDTYHVNPRSLIVLLSK